MADILDDWLTEDFGDGDVTSQSVVDNSPCRAEVTGGPGIISGLRFVINYCPRSMLRVIQASPMVTESNRMPRSFLYLEKHMISSG